MKQNLSIRHILFFAAAAMLIPGNSPALAKKSRHSQKETSLAIDGIIHEKMPRGSRTGIFFWDLEDNRVIYEHEPNVMCQPASCLKLMTAVTTLDLGHDQPFTTQFWTNGRLLSDSNRKNILQGDLYIVGGFDPTITLKDVDSIIENLRLSSISGNIYADVSAMDSVYFGPGWWWDDAQFAYQPYLSPLTVNQGKVSVMVYPTFTGNAAGVKIEPKSSYYRLENNSVTIPEDSAGSVRISRKWMQNSNTIVVEGNVNGYSSKEMNLFSSQDMFMNMFIERLNAHGVRNNGNYSFAELPIDTIWTENNDSLVHSRSYRLASSVAELYYEHSTPFESVLYPMLKESINLYAECMFMRTAAKTLNKKHISWSQAVLPEKKLANELDFEEGTYAIKDGSGLSNVNFISPRQIVELLKYAYNKPKIFDILYNALPINGVDGTLIQRMSGSEYAGRVHAKTGSLSVASTLAGYARLRNGHMTAFCIMNQNYIGASKARAMQDALLSYIIDNVR